MANVPKISMNTDLSDGLCFGCGQNNPIGLRLDFHRDGDSARAEFTPGEHFQGWPGVVHGGIIVSMLDEAMSYAAYFEGMTCLTARMDIRLKQMARVGEPLLITSAIVKNSRKLIQTRARVARKEGGLIAEGSATHYVINADSAGAGESPDVR